MFKVQDVNSGRFLAFNTISLSTRGRTWRYRKWAERAIEETKGRPVFDSCDFVVVEV